jgi:hypothetical protein
MCGFPFLGTREPIVNCHKMKEKMFSRSLGTETLTSLVRAHIFNCSKKIMIFPYNIIRGLQGREIQIYLWFLIVLKLEFLGTVLEA